LILKFFIEAKHQIRSWSISET